MRLLLAALPLLSIAAETGAATLTARSEPAGVVAEMTTFHTAGAQVSTGIAADRRDLGLLFTHWSVTPSTQSAACGSGRCADAVGQALQGVEFSIAADTVATAHYVSAALDADTDGLPDGVELRLFGTLDALPSDDRDGDGRSLAEELMAGSSPLLTEVQFVGGVTRAPVSALTLLLGTGSVFLHEISSPAGIVVQRRVLPLGSSTLTSIAPQRVGTWQFGWWAIQGLPQRDAVGLPLVRAPVVLDVETTAVAVYLDVSADIDADGIPDWMEYRWFGGLGLDGAADGDGDGILLHEEILRGLIPLLLDRSLAGGIARSSPLPLSLDLTGAFRVLLGSTPAGVIAAQSIPVAAGVVYRTPAAPLRFNALRFVCWRRDSVDIRDAAGMCSAGSVSVLMPASDVTMDAAYFDAAMDTDADGLPDWFELASSAAGALAPDDDPDGDGISASDEFLRGLSVSLAETQRPGGISRSSRGPSVRFRIFENGFE